MNYMALNGRQSGGIMTPIREPVAMWKAAVLVLFWGALAAPPPLHVCHTSDPKIQTCLRDSFNQVFRNARNGLKQIGLPRLEPFSVPLLELNLGAGNVSANVVFRDVEITGLTLTDVLTIKANVQERKLEVTSRTPSLEVAGHFVMEGGLLSFPLYASDQFHVNTTDVLSVIILYYKITDGYVAVESLSLDLIPSHIAYDMGESLDGDNILGEGMNEFLNENSHEVFTALKPRVTKLLGDVLGGVLDQFFRHFSVEQLLPE